MASQTPPNPPKPAHGILGPNVSSHSREVTIGSIIVTVGLLFQMGLVGDFWRFVTGVGAGQKFEQKDWREAKLGDITFEAPFELKPMPNKMSGNPELEAVFASSARIEGGTLGGFQVGAIVQVFHPNVQADFDERVRLLTDEFVALFKKSGHIKKPARIEKFDRPDFAARRCRFESDRQRFQILHVARGASHWGINVIYGSETNDVDADRLLRSVMLDGRPVLP